MRTKNFKGEDFIPKLDNTLTDLNNICNTLIENMLSSNKSHFVFDIIKGKNFSKLWNLNSNNLGNKYSKNEFKGVYAFAKVDGKHVDFQYIGISQTIKRRFSQHTKRKTRQEATWAYIMAKDNNPHQTNRELEMAIPAYQEREIYPLKFTFCTVNDNMLLHLAEIYCVNELKSFWNSFETH